MHLTKTHLICSLVVLSSCGVETNKSGFKGHYEDSTETELLKYKGRQTIVPEYAPSEAVLISADLLLGYDAVEEIRAIAETDVSSIFVVGSRSELDDFRAEVSAKAALRPFTNKFKNILDNRSSHTVWARDWAPLLAKNEAGQLQLMDFNYYPRRPVDDATPTLMSRLDGTTRISIPVYNEGGNFMINGRGDCLATERVSDANNRVQVPNDIILNKEQISQYFKDYAGCTTSRILPRMPTEGTGHIDMWAKFVTDDTILVGEISQSILDEVGGRVDKALNKKVQDFLNTQAQTLAGLGFKVVRIPMPLVEDGIFRSYTNSLTLNGTAIIPQYKVMYGGSQYSDSKFLKGYETAVTAAYQAAGYKVVFATSDSSIASGGAVHCTTMQIPR